MGEHAKLYMGKDIYFWNFIVLMVFTLFELGAVFFETVPGTEIDISRSAVWAILIVVGLVKGYGIAAYFMHLKDEHKWFNITFLFPWIFVALMLWVLVYPTQKGSLDFQVGARQTGRTQQNDNPVRGKIQTLRKKAIDHAPTKVAGCSPLLRSACCCHTKRRGIQRTSIVSK